MYKRLLSSYETVLTLYLSVPWTLGTRRVKNELKNELKKCVKNELGFYFVFWCGLFRIWWWDSLLFFFLVFKFFGVFFCELIGPLQRRYRKVGLDVLVSDLGMGTHLMAIILEGVEFSDFVTGEGTMDWILADGEDSAKEKGTAVQVDKVYFCLFSFRTLNFSSFWNFTKLRSYFKLCSLIFSA